MLVKPSTPTFFMLNINPLQPKVIRTALQRLSAGRLPLLLTHGVYQRPDRRRSIRSDFVANIRKVLLFLVSHCDLMSGNVLCRVSGNEFITVTSDIIADKTNLCGRTVKRILAYLVSLGLVDPERQRKPLRIPNLNGFYLLFCSITRRLTDKFWDIIGLLNEYKKSRAGRLNREMTIRRQTTRRFFLEKKEKTPVRPSDARLTTSPGQTSRPHQNGPTSLADLFRKAAGLGIPIPDHLLK